MDLNLGGIVSVVVPVGLPAVQLVSQALCIVIAAKIFRLPNRSFGKAFVGSLVVSVVSVAVTAGLSRAFSTNPWLPALMISLVAGAVVVSRLYRSSYVAGLGTLLLSNFLSLLVTVFVIIPGWLLGLKLLEQGAMQLKPPGLPESIQLREITPSGTSPTGGTTPTAF